MTNETLERWERHLVLAIAGATLALSIVSIAHGSAKPAKGQPRPADVTASFYLQDDVWQCIARNEYGYTVLATNKSIDAAFSGAVDQLD